MTAILQHIETLCALRGPSGREDAVRTFLLKTIGDKAECKTDALGNLLVHKKGKSRAKKRVMLAAHMDEVGFIITGITEEGLLKFSTVGGIDTAVLLGRAVRVGDAAIPGVIGVKPIHFLEGDQREKLPDAADLYIDIGAENKEAAEKLPLAPGDMGSFDSEIVPFGEGFLKGRALDDRAGCAILLEMILNEQPFDLDIAFTVQEEVGLRGASAAAFTLAPDCAIVVETTTAADLPEIEGEKRVCVLGEGAAVSFMDRSTVYNNGLYRHALARAAEKGIPVQPKTQVAGGNDAGVIHQSRAGVKTLTVSLPCRYLHSASCVIQEKDIQSVYDLVRQLAADFADDTID